VPKTLTPLQAEVLQLFFKCGAADWGYFLTGGTALSEYYLQHRRSEDLDLFNRSGRNPAEDAAVLQHYLEPRGIQMTSESAGVTFARIYVSRRPDEWLRIELANDVRQQIAPLRDFEGIRVDSLEDIAVNKICALSRQEPKDCIDLYFILTETSLTLEYLLERARLKDAAFDDARAHLQFASDLLRVSSLAVPALMIKPLSLEEMRSRLKAEAEKIIRRLAPGG